MNIRSLSISGLITLDMHALNNEGAEGNHLHTRWCTSPPKPASWRW